MTAPSAQRSGRDGGEGERGNVPLRLAATGGALGLELYRPLVLGPLRVEHAAWSLPGLSFPVDLSGGVASFRHRRGALEYLEVSAELSALEAHLSRKLGKLRLQAPRVDLWSLDHGLGIGLRHDDGALAFDLAWIPSATAARAVVTNARGSGRVELPLGYALRVCDTLVSSIASRDGRIFEVSDLAALLMRSIAPALGVRAPATSGMVVDALRWQGQRAVVSLRKQGAPPELTPQAIRASELAQLCKEADNELAGGQLDRARERYMAALEKAPRSAELVGLVAQIDATTEDRAEAALGLLVDCMPATEFGAIGAQLLARVGDRTGAHQAALNAASREGYAPVAAGYWCSLASVAESAEERQQYLNRAVATAPAMAYLRWQRLQARLEWGDEQGVIVDAEHLEAGASNPHARHDILARIGNSLVERGFARSAARVFERALRFVPDDPQATCGLGLSLIQMGRQRRAIALLERSLELSDDQGTDNAEALLALAKVLVSDIGDMPQAIARLSRIAASSSCYLEACALQGRFRAALGDLTGASLAFARLREACELQQHKTQLGAAARWLCEAAQFERGQRNDLHAAERHLACALRLAPSDRRIASQYRSVARLLAGASSPAEG